MGVFDDSTRKLAGGDLWSRHVKPERLAGQYAVYEGYDDDGLGRLRTLSRRTRAQLAAALDREAITAGVLGLAVGVAIGAALVWRRRR
jgi:hypothetical protein